MSQTQIFIYASIVLCKIVKKENKKKQEDTKHATKKFETSSDDIMHDYLKPSQSMSQSYFKRLRH